MKNITLSVDENDLQVARRYAAEHNTTVNRLVKDYIRQIAKVEDRARKARENLVKLAEESSAKAGNATWTRDELYDR